MICRATVGLGVTLLSVGAVAFVLYFGIPSLALLEELADTAADSLIRTLTDTVLSLYETMETELPFNPADLHSLSTLLVTTVFNFLPAVFLLLCGTVAFFAHSLYTALLANSSNKEDPEFSLSLLTSLRFEMSAVSAVVFLVGFLLSLVLESGEYALYGLVAENLLLILMPGLVFTTHLGIRRLMLKKGPSCLSSLLYFAYLASFFYLSSLVLMLSSLVGAVLVLVRTVRAARQNKE